MNANGTVQDPDLRALLNAHLVEVLGAMSCVRVGRIISFDYILQTASVEVMAKRVVYNKAQTAGELQQIPTIVDYPVLTDVPVVVLGGGGKTGGFIETPIAKGDECVLFFNDGDLDNWFTTGTPAIPNSPRMHSLSDGIALVGIASKGNAKALESQTLGFKWGDNVIHVQAAGGGLFRLEIQNANGTQINLNEDGSLHIHSADGANIGTISGKVYIYNSTNGLKQALDSLCDTLTAWVNTGGSTPNPATLLAITATKTLIDNILT